MTPSRDQQSVERIAKETVWAFMQNHGLREAFIEKDLERALIGAINAALTAHDEALPGEWTEQTVEEIEGKSSCARYSRKDIAAAHNSALRLLVDAMRKIQYRIEEQLVGIEDEQVLAWIRDDAATALQPYSGQKDGKP